MDVSELQASLREHRARLDEVDEVRRLSNNQADYGEVLRIVETMIEELTKKTLEHLGEPSQPGDSTAELLGRLSDAITGKPERFADGAPLGFLADLVARQEQNLKDVGYLRLGFGLGSRRPKPADMKWDHVSSVVSDALDTFSRLFDSLGGDGAEIQRLIPEVDFDLASTRIGIVKLLERSLGPSEFMSEVIELGKSQTRLAGWDVFRDLPYQTEIDQRSSFFIDVLMRERPSRAIAGFYVGIAYPNRQGETVADLQLMGSDTYHVDDEEWFDHINYTPRESYAGSEVLASIHSLAYAPGGLGNVADYTLCLAWGSYLARACARRYLEALGSDFIGVRVGFGGGDWIDLGWVRHS